MEKEISKKRKRNKKKRKKPILISCIIMIFLVLGATFTWYLFTKDNHGDRKEAKIMTPYFLYLLNPDDTHSLQFSVGNIHPGETKQIVICVSNKKPVDDDFGSIDIARESDFNYDLEFIYTENLAVNYKIYEMEKHTDDGTAMPEDAVVLESIDGMYWTKAASGDGTQPVPLVMASDVTETRHTEVFGNAVVDDVINKGRYELYKQDSNGNPLHLTYKNDTYEFDYYMIEISWKDNIKFADYTKETDLLYVVVNAKQPEPIKQESD